MPISVAIVEDDASYRAEIVPLLNRTPGFRCVGEFPSAEAALSGLPSLRPNVALVDIELPGSSGIELVRRLQESAPDTLSVMLTVFADTNRIFASLRAGAHGYVLKETATPAKILVAIQEVVEGGAPMSRDIARKVLQHFHAPPKPAAAPETLTPREREILDQIVQGYVPKEIADRLGVSWETIRTHLRNIHEKLHVHTRAGAVAEFLRRSRGP
jgi:DNA-binding NarL/FixJ family response regulator